jgi:type II restriction enzyme
MIKNLYSSAALVVANPDNSTEGDYDNISRQTSIETFIKKLENHCELLASYE